jgi:aconitate hydratase
LQSLKQNNKSLKNKHMAFDIEMIKKVYAALPAKVEAARKMTGKPLTLTEKILYTHLAEALPVAAIHKR